MADIPNQHDRAALKGQLTAIRRLVGPVRVHFTRERLAAFGDIFLQLAIVQPQPVAVREYLILSIHRGHAVLTVHDGRDSRLHHHIGDARGVGRADIVVPVDDNLDVEAVVLQQHSVQRVFPCETREFRLVLQGRHPVRGQRAKAAIHHTILGDVSMARPLQRRDVI